MPLDPLHVPAGLWARDDLRQVLRRRDIGGLFRLVTQETGTSQTQLGAAVGLEQGYVSRVIAGRKVTSIEVLERIADGLAMPDDARHALGLAGRQPPYRLDMGDSRLDRQSAAPVNRSWRDDVAGAVEMWRGDVNRREVLRQAAFSSAGYTVSALRWFTSRPTEPRHPGRLPHDRATRRRHRSGGHRHLPAAGQPVRWRPRPRRRGPLPRPGAVAAVTGRPLRRHDRPGAAQRHGRTGAARRLAGVRHGRTRHRPALSRPGTRPGPFRPPRQPRRGDPRRHEPPGHLPRRHRHRCRPGPRRGTDGKAGRRAGTRRRGPGAGGPRPRPRRRRPDLRHRPACRREDP